MSSTLVSMAPSAASISPSATPTPASNGSGPPFNTSTLLFGFIVSALSIFGVFMTSAIIWSRLIARRRAIEAMMVLSSSTGTTRTLRRPRMWDVRVVSDKMPLRWLDENPLAANCDRLGSLPRSSRSEQTVPFWKRHLLAHLPPEITYLFHHPIPAAIPSPNDTDISPAELTNGSDLQVSLLISMPRAPSTRERQDKNNHSLHELVLGTTNVVYHDPALS